MERNHFKKLLFLFLLIGMSFSVPVKKKITVWMIGDSTMCHYNSKEYPLTGWGMPFANYFDTSVVIKNKARGGRSTRTFLSEGLWQAVKDSLQTGDYVFIQFGHNDESKGYPERYTPPIDYRNNLIALIQQTRSMHAIPILITPVSRRKFDSKGIAQETHEEYSSIVRQVAEQNEVGLIDLDAMSMKLLQQYGPDNSKLLFNLLLPGEEPNYPQGLSKNATHFNAYGARLIAELVLKAVDGLHLDLANHIINHKK